MPLFSALAKLLAAGYTFLAEFHLCVVYPLWPGARAFSRLPNDKKGKALGTRLPIVAFFATAPDKIHARNPSTISSIECGCAKS
jgi:hypothetical protein